MEVEPVAAEVQNLGILSAHADREQILALLDTFKAPPRMTFIVHGEPASADCLRRQLEERLAWSYRVPDYLQRFALGTTAGRTGCEPRSSYPQLRSSDRLPH